MDAQTRQADTKESNHPKHKLLKGFGELGEENTKQFSLVQNQGSMPEGCRYLSVQNDYAAAIREFREMT